MTNATTEFSLLFLVSLVAPITLGWLVARRRPPELFLQSAAIVGALTGATLRPLLYIALGEYDRAAWFDAAAGGFLYGGLFTCLVLWAVRRFVGRPTPAASSHDR